MIWRGLGAAKDEITRKRINRAPWPVLATGLPWLSIMLASMVSFSPVIASAPVMPPFSYLMLLAWRMLRPGMLPVWAGLPLGFFDDLYSGQPFGSGILLWSATMLAMEVIDERFLWRGFLQDWLAASVLTPAYLLLCAMFAWGATGYPLPLVIVPQVLLSIIIYPVMTRIVALFDRVRLLPLKRL
ncbi:rod shape-determining protein MreD [Novosphingobium sp. SL115]|uniref:rod shape-determining protein MreD n=1 Tax=Novosphingobium sp. SL115 TaxID=2995150 RepID=UPI0022722F07|nr:rod shape-determining protein MreD [Novosphingobium sp. SL115]MCY1671554.1 rod shape-determining protein MreD [Novosphingobium sp. SL115]